MKDCDGRGVVREARVDDVDDGRATSIEANATAERT